VGALSWLLVGREGFQFGADIATSKSHYEPGPTIRPNLRSPATCPSSFPTGSATIKAATDSPTPVDLKDFNSPSSNQNSKKSTLNNRQFFSPTGRKIVLYIWFYQTHSSPT